MDATANVPASIQAEAKVKALAVLNSDPNCVSYVRPEDLETAMLFIPVVSIIKPHREDFYDAIPGIGVMPKPPLVHLMKEKSGIDIIRTETRKRGEYIWVAHCYGEKRQPDGSMLHDDASYEFDAAKRAELDCINQPDKYKSDIAKRKHLLETAKFGEQRAVTGAQFALIRKLGKISHSWKTSEEAVRGMMVVRIDRNTNGLLADPMMRKAALEMALGATREVYGPEPKQIETTGQSIDAQPAESIQEEENGMSFPEEEPPATAEPTEVDKLKSALLDWNQVIPANLRTQDGAVVRETIAALIKKPDAAVDELKKMIARCEKFNAARKGGTA
jgi:hypothetical protein